MVAMSVAKTSTVSIRELKEGVGDLVARAARGERILVTRYGTPRAVLSAFGASATPGSSSAQRSGANEFDREERAFDRLLAQGRLAAHRGRYVGVRGGRVIDHDPDAPTLVRRLGIRLGRRIFFVGFVGADEPAVDLPGDELR